MMVNAPPIVSPQIEGRLRETVEDFELIYQDGTSDAAMSFTPMIQQMHSYVEPSVNRAEVFFRPKGQSAELFYQALSDDEACMVTKRQLKWLIHFFSSGINEKPLIIDEFFVNVEPVALSYVVAELISLRDLLLETNVKLVIEITERNASLLHVGLVKELHECGLCFAIDDFYFDSDPRKALLSMECVHYIKADVNAIRALDNPINELKHYSSQSLIIEKVESIYDIDICLQIRCEAIQGFYLSQPMGIKSIYVN